MKMLYRILSTTLLLVCLATVAFAKTKVPVPIGDNNLAAGDIAIVSYQSDFDPTNANNPAVAEFEDRFSIVVLKSGGIPEGTVLYFTDRGWDGPNSTWLDNATVGHEGVIKWVVPTGGIAQGTEIYFINKYHDEVTAGTEYYEWNAYSDNAGTTLLGTVTTETTQPTDGMGFSVAGDNLIVYQTGPTSGLAGAYNNTTIRFITALLANNTGSTTYAGWDATPTTLNESSLPPGLVNGQTAFVMSPGPLPAAFSSTNEPDNGKYNCTNASSCTALALSSAIYDPANWTFSDAVFTAGNSSSNCTYRIAPLITVSAPTVTQPSCAVQTGTIVVNASGSANLEYALNSGAYQSSATFSTLAAGSYTIHVRDQNTPNCITDYSSTVDLIAATGCNYISAGGNLAAFSTCAGTVSAEQSFTVEGVGLSANLVVTAPSGLEVSLSSGSGFGSSVSITPTSGTVSTTNIYVRISASASGDVSGNIVCSSTGVTNQNVAVTAIATLATSTADAGVNKSLCQGVTTVAMTAVVPTSGTGTWTQVGGPVSASIITPNSANTNITGLSVLGTYTFRWTINNAPCQSNFDEVDVVVNPNPASFTISGGNKTVCQGTITTLTGPADPNYSYDWGRSFSGIINPNSYTSLGVTTQSLEVTTSGNYKLTVTNQFGCTARDTANVSVADYVYNGTLAAGDLQQTGRLNRFAAVSTCAAPKSCPLTFTTAGARYYDSYSVTNSSTVPVCATIGLASSCGTSIFTVAYLGSYNPTSLCTNYLADPGSSFPGVGYNEVTIPANSTIVLVVHEVNPGTGCAGYQLTVEMPRDPASITVSPAPPVCAGSQVGLTANGIANSYSWSPGGASTAAINVNPTVVASTYSVTYAYGNNGCTSTIDTTLSIAPVPTTANAGTNNSTCSSSITLAANSPQVGTGTWTQVSGPGTVNFDDNHSPVAVATATSFGTYTLRWTIATTGNCASSTQSDVTITFSDIPTIANAGANRTACISPGTISMSANVPTAGTGTWTQVGGPVSANIISPNSASSTITGLSTVGTYTFRWTISNAPCTASFDDVDVVVNPNPAAFSITGANRIVCEGGIYTLAAPVDPNYTYDWSRSLFNTFSSLGVTTQTLNVTTSGIYRAVVTNQFGCSTSDTFAISVADNVYNGTLAAGDAQQTGRLNRFATISTCAAPKSCPLTFTTAGARYYDSYTITNPRNVPVCATIGTFSSCGTSFFCATYLGSYNPTSLCTNYLADPGSSFTTVGYYEATIPANGTIVVVVHEVNPGTGCAGYTLTVEIPHDPAGITATPPTVVCNGTSVLTAPVANNYSWSPGGATTQTITTAPLANSTKYYVTSGYGNWGCTATDSVTVNVNSVLPTITCPGNISQNNTPGQCGAVVTYTTTPAGTPAPAVTYSFTGATTGSGNGDGSGSTFNVGVTNVTVTVTNSCGTNNCSFTVTINDNEAPSITAGTISSCYQTVSAAEAAAIAATSATDNCNGNITKTASTVGTCSALITVTVKDANNNPSSTTYNTRIDNTPPSITCPAAITVCGAAGVPAADINSVTTSDNCPGTITVTFVGDAGNVSTTSPYVLTRTYRATDGCGNFAECTQQITVNPVPAITAPTVTQPGCAVATGTIQVNATGTGTLEYSLNGGNFQTSPVFTTLIPGNYIISVRSQDYPNCVVAYTGNPVVINPQPILTLPATEGFESTTFPPNGWTRFNPDNGITWARSTIAANAGIASARMNCFNYSTKGEVDILQTPKIITTGVTVLRLNFDLAYARYSNVLTDTLEIVYSTDCGVTWIPTGYKKTQQALATNGGGFIIGSFSPTAAQWRNDTVKINLCGQENSVMVGFKMINGFGNNCYIDNVSLSAQPDEEAPKVTTGTIAGCFPTVGDAEAAALAATTATDNCPGTITKTAATVGTCSAVITITATDIANNSTSVTYNTRIDNTAPTVTAGSINSCYSDIASAETAALAATTVSDDCPGTITKTASTVGTCSAVITITGTDGCGNNASVTYNTRIDNTPPTVTCPAAVTVSCVSEVPAVNINDVTVSDNCPGTITVIHVGDVISNQTCANRYTITRTYRATDGCGNFAECTQIITVNDQTPPTLTCPAAVTVSCASAVPPVNINDVTGVSDNCNGIVTITHISDVISNQTCANRYTITRTYRATDVCGNFTECTQIITVNDQTPPTLTCPAAVTVSCASAVPAADINAVTGVSDNCNGAVVVTFEGDVISNQTCPNRYTITRTYRATDVCGNFAECSQIITVNDQTPPTLTCPAAVTVSCASAVPPVDINSVSAVSDNCNGAVVVTHVSDVISNQTCPNRYTITRTYRATDACGNFSECTQIITVNDQTPPTLSCPAAVTVSCASAVPAVDINAVTAVSDNCNGTVTVTHVSDVISNQTCPNRYTITRTYRATDACGNFTECTQIITVNDQTPPTMTCPAPVTVSCASAVPVPNINAVTGVSDNCNGTVTVTHVGDVISNQTCPNRYTVTRTYRATDACGNFTECTQIITVNDQTPPTMTCPAAITVSCASAVPAANINAVTAVSDNCNGTVTVTHIGDVISNQTCPNRYTVTRTYRATDACGNFTECTQIITVNDQTPPTLTCPAAITVCGPAAVPAANIALVTGVSDNCNGAVVITHVGDVNNCPTCTVVPYTITRTYRATDACGNTADCSQTITVNPIPVMTAIGNQELCNGFPTTAVTFNSTVALTTFNWTNSNPSIGLAASGTSTGIPSFNARNTGAVPVTATITVTPVSYGCTGNSVSFTITVNPTPVVSLNSFADVCNLDASFTLSGGSPLGGIYFVDGVQQTVFNPPAYTPGTHSIVYQYTNIYGCTNTSLQTIIVHPQPAKPVVVPVLGFGIHSSVVENSYTWYLFGNPQINSDVQYYFPQTSGYYQVQVTTQYGCSTRSDSLYYIPEKYYTGGSDGQLVFVYPVPARVNDGIHVHFNIPTKYPVKFRLYTNVGQLLQQDVIPVNTRGYIIDLKKLPPTETYLLRLYDEYSMDRSFVIPISR